MPASSRRTNLSTLAFASVIAIASVSAAPVQAERDACALLSSAAIEKNLGESVKNTKPTSQVQGGVRFSQCFYTLQTFTKSISVTLTSPAGGDRDAARELWQRWFHKEAVEDPDRKSARGGSEEEEVGASARPVSGLGDEAFWVQSFVGNLYVRRGDRYIRISIGGKQTDAERLATAKALASEALGHMLGA